MRNANVNVIASQLSCLPHDLLAERITYALDVLFESAHEERELKRDADERASKANEEDDKKSEAFWNEEFHAANAAEGAYEYALKVFAENVLRCDIPFLLK